MTNRDMAYGGLTAIQAHGCREIISYAFLPEYRGTTDTRHATRLIVRRCRQLRRYNAARAGAAR